MGSEENQSAEGDGENDAPERNQVEGAVVGALPAVRDPTAGNGAANAVDDGNGADHEAGIGHGEAVDAVQKRGHPGGDSTQREGDGGQAKGRGEEGRVHEDFAALPDEVEQRFRRYISRMSLSWRSGLLLAMVLRAAFRLAAPHAVEPGDDQAGDGAEEKGPTPSPQAAQFPARKIAECRAYGNGQIEDGEDAVAVALRIEICEHGGGVDAEGGLAYANQRAPGVEAQVGVHKGSTERGQAPENRAGDDERLAAKPVAQPTAERRTDHVGEEECCGERAHLLVGCAELFLDEWLRTGEDVAIEVIEQIERDQQQKCSQSGIHAGAQRLERSWQGSEVRLRASRSPRNTTETGTEGTRDQGNKKTVSEGATGL